MIMANSVTEISETRSAAAEWRYVALDVYVLQYIYLQAWENSCTRDRLAQHMVLAEIKS